MGRIFLLKKIFRIRLYSVIFDDIVSLVNKTMAAGGLSGLVRASHQIRPGGARIPATIDAQLTKQHKGDKMAKTKGSEDPWLTPKQVAERMGLSEQTVRRLMDAGRLPGVIVGRKIRRVLESELIKFAKGK
jgi:excisionase family DNA binding protein